MKFLVLAIMTLQLIVKTFAKLPTFNVFGDALKYEDNRTYPNKFNPTCMSASCPGLFKHELCPYKSDGSFNCETINRTMSILNECIATRNPICNTTIDPIPIPPFYFSFDQFLLNEFNASCSMAPKTASVTKLSHSVFSVSKDQCVSDGCVQFTVTNPDLHYYGSGNCDFDLRSTDFPLSVTYAMNLPFTVTNKLICKNTKAIAQSPRIVTNPLITLGKFPSIVQHVITVRLSRFVKSSQLTKALALFVNHLATNAIEATEQSCSNKSLN